MNLHVNIDYSEGEPASYRGVVVTASGGHGCEVMRWASGDPQTDWQSFVDWAVAGRGIILTGSSITHFLWDVPGWRMILNGAGQEVIVPEDRPRWLALQGSAEMDESDALDSHPDLSVRAWNARLDGVSQTEICEQLGIGGSRLRSMFSIEPPQEILEDLRYLTERRGVWIVQGPSDRLMDSDGKEAAFVVLLLPWRLTGKTYRSGVNDIQQSIRAAGRPNFSLGHISERAPLAGLLRLVHDRGYPAWVINPDGTAQVYDGRHAALVAPPATATDLPEPAPSSNTNTGAAA